MLRFKILFSVGFLCVFLCSCEVCSDCTWTGYEVVCSCEANDGRTSSSEPQLVQQDELVEHKESCELDSACELNSTPLTREDAICGRKIEVASAIADLRLSGWQCTDASG